MVILSQVNIYLQVELSKIKSKDYSVCASEIM